MQVNIEFKNQTQINEEIKEDIVVFIKQKIGQTPNITHAISVDESIEYKDLLNCWQYYRTTNEEYQQNFNSFGHMTPELDAYSIEFKKYPLLEELFKYITRIDFDSPVNSMITFYIKNQDSFLVMVRSDTILNNLYIKMAEHYINEPNIESNLEKYKNLMYKKPFWTFIMSIPNAMDNFNDFFLKNNIFNRCGVCVFVY
jgi:hypothetical protein